MGMSNRVSRLSSQPIYVPVRVEHPLTGHENLSTITPEVAITFGDPVASDYRAAIVLTPGTWEGPDGEPYYIVSLNFPADVYAAGTYHVWVKFEVDAVEHVMRAGKLQVY